MPFISVMSFVGSSSFRFRIEKLHIVSASERKERERGREGEVRYSLTNVE